MPLTQRAQIWLATLPRETPMPTVQVERLIREAGGVPHALWLDFHERYAGYVETVGPDDLAVWGLSRLKDAVPPSRWTEPESVWVVPPGREDDEIIGCAEAHPVHEYQLTPSGWFRGLGGPCPSFDMKVERHGVMHEFYARGRGRRTLLTSRGNAPENQKILHDVATWLVPEASTEVTQFYLCPDRLVIYDPPLRQLQVFETIATP